MFNCTAKLQVFPASIIFLSLLLQQKRCSGAIYAYEQHRKKETRFPVRNYFTVQLQPRKYRTPLSVHGFTQLHREKGFFSIPICLT